MSKRTLYAHFRTKGELVLAHLEDLSSRGTPWRECWCARMSPPGSEPSHCSTRPQRARIPCADARSSTPPRSSPTPGRGPLLRPRTETADGAAGDRPGSGTGLRARRPRRATRAPRGRRRQPRHGAGRGGLRPTRANGGGEILLANALPTHDMTGSAGSPVCPTPVPSRRPPAPACKPNREPASRTWPPAPFWGLGLLRLVSETPLATSPGAGLPIPLVSLGSHLDWRVRGGDEDAGAEGWSYPISRPTCPVSPRALW
ncbi:hypothetical protein [Streptomyces sp. SID8358]|uniref:hypothetical protein n=1 Tax=Streptomyces sp. SID8358 TaxID=2690342 RepID=UPI0031F86F19